MADGQAAVFEGRPAFIARTRILHDTTVRVVFADGGQPAVVVVVETDRPDLWRTA